MGVDTNCGGECNGYYANHFLARFYANDVPGLSNYYETVVFQDTLTEANQHGDEWTVIELGVYSGGFQIYSDTSKANDYRTEAYSSYWQNFHFIELIEKGNNKIEFNFIYRLKYPSGRPAETWFPIRRASVI